MSARQLRATIAGVSVLTLGALTACDSGEEASSESTLVDTPDVATVAPPAERQTPFCEGILHLDAQLDAAAPDADTAEIILDAYDALVDVVPPEIRDDFLTVVAALQAGPVDTSPILTSPTLAAPPETSTSGTAPPTTGEDFEEGYTPDDDAASRLNAYIQFACRDSDNNPGPSPTQPAPPPVSSTAAP